MVAEIVTLQQFPSRALQAYSQLEFTRLDRKRAMFRSLPKEDQDLLPEFEARISAMTSCVDANARFLAKMADSADTITSSSSSQHEQQEIPSPPMLAGVEEGEDNSDPYLRLQEDPKVVLNRGVRRGFANLATDWSSAGASERSKIYVPIVNAVDEAFEEAKKALRSLKRDSFRVLVPGAGSGRLAWELVSKGYCVEGCEESFIELLIGNFIMNNTTATLNNENNINDSITKFKLYPYVHEHRNMRCKDSVTRSVEVPDVNPKDVPSSADFTMRAGRFIDAYDGQDNVWDVVASFRAFDVGENALDHTRRVAQILKPGGIWVVVGPTPCVEGAQGDGVHISAEDFMDLIRRCGFKIIKSESITCLYSTDEKSLRTIHVECPFVVAVKVRPLA